VSDVLRAKRWVALTLSPGVLLIFFRGPLFMAGGGGQRAEGRGLGKNSVKLRDPEYVSGFQTADVIGIFISDTVE